MPSFLHVRCTPSELGAIPRQSTLHLGGRVEPLGRRLRIRESGAHETTNHYGRSLWLEGFGEVETVLCAAEV